MVVSCDHTNYFTGKLSRLPINLQTFPPQMVYNIWYVFVLDFLYIILLFMAGHVYTITLKVDLAKCSFVQQRSIVICSCIYQHLFVIGSSKCIGKLIKLASAHTTGKLAFYHNLMTGHIKALVLKISRLLLLWLISEACQMSTIAHLVNGSISLEKAVSSL